MEAGQFADFWRLQGYRVVRTKSGYWYSPYWLSSLSVPYHHLITPSWWELAQVFMLAPSAMVRFPGVADDTGEKGGLFVCADRHYDFPVLQPRTRTMTRRGLENCSIHQMDFRYLAEHGHALNIQTFVRQGRSPDSITEQQWHRYCKAANQITDFEAWGTFVNGHLAAFMVTALIEGVFSILHASSASEYLPYYPNNALVFTVTKMKLSCSGIDYVSYGLKSLDDTAGLNRFKIHMGFCIKPFKECIVLNPLLKPLVSMGGNKAVHWMALRYPKSDLWRKASRTLSLIAAG